MGVMAKLVHIMWVPVLLSVFYVCWVFWQRRPTESPARVERDPMAVHGSSVKILQFYAGAREIAPGEKTLICYGVVNATTIRLDPPAEKMWPAVSRCFEVTPVRSTRYTLTAEGANNMTVSESIEIAVRW
jgi:hypothetical protein